MEGSKLYITICTYSGRCRSPLFGHEAASFPCQVETAEIRDDRAMALHLRNTDLSVNIPSCIRGFPPQSIDLCPISYSFQARPEPEAGLRNYFTFFGSEFVLFPTGDDSLFMEFYSEQRPVSLSLSRLSPTSLAGNVVEAGFFDHEARHLFQYLLRSRTSRHRPYGWNQFESGRCNRHTDGISQSN